MVLRKMLRHTFAQFANPLPLESFIESLVTLVKKLKLIKIKE
jgi:hypothetical protein